MNSLPKWKLIRQYRRYAAKMRSLGMSHRGIPSDRRADELEAE